LRLLSVEVLDETSLQLREMFRLGTQPPRLLVIQISNALKFIKKPEFMKNGIVNPNMCFSGQRMSHYYVAWACKVKKV
jgi:hypothetical protein